MGRISLLEFWIVDPEGRLSRYQNPKNSGSSSIPPSKEENRPKKMQSLREDSRRKSGGLPGHAGHTLENLFSLFGKPPTALIRTSAPGTQLYRGKIPVNMG